MDVKNDTHLAASICQEVEPLLAKTPADDYGVWFEVGCAVKHLGLPYENFRKWSATSDKFDEDECAQKWEELPDEPRAGWPTLRKYAGAASFVPVPEQMLAEPQTEDESAAQAAHYIATRFKPDEEFELCGWKPDPHKENHLIPDRYLPLPRLEDSDTEESLSMDEGFRSWVREGILGGVVVSQNPVEVPADYKGFAPKDEMVSRCDLALVECDGVLVEDQWAKLKQMRLPIVSVVYSGNESLHIACRIDAGPNAQLYKDRVNKLYDYVRSFDFKLDEKCKNASRLTRLPGAMRDGKRQYVVCWSCGYPDWETFELCELSHLTTTATKSSSPIEEGSYSDQCARALPTAVPCAPDETALLGELEGKYGSPFTLTAKGKVAQITEAFWAEYVKRQHRLIKFDDVIWHYDNETGVWSQVDSAKLHELVVLTAHHYGAMTEHEELVNKMTDPICTHIRRFMSNSKEDPFLTRPHNVIHVANGMLEISIDGTCSLKPFAREYYSKNQCNIAYNPDAKCPRFMSELLEPMLQENDIETLLLYGAQCLLPDNDTQKFLVISGTPGGGKDSFVNIIGGLVGGENCTELRMKHLGNPFEIAGFIGKSLLLGNDVGSNFLRCENADLLKKICGGNMLDAEIKGVTKKFQIKGLFKMIITSNSRLLVKVDDDMGAWERRMLWVTFDGPPPAKPIPDFAGVLLREEGEGILNLLIQKATELISHGFPKESSAHNRVVRLLLESDSACGFLSASIEKVDSGPGITQAELVEKYISWCKANDCTPVLGNEGRRKLTTGMESIFHVTMVHNLVRGVQNNLRGYHGVAFKTDLPTV